MKMTLLLTVLLSLAPTAWARTGVDNSGGGMGMPMVTLDCQGTKIQFREFSIDNGRRMGAQPTLWITSPGNAMRTISTTISYAPNGGRVFDFGDFFCKRSLTEQTQTSWQLLSSCEGKNFATQCERLIGDCSANLNK
ncbi:MAG: hypothetical protein AB7K68_16260 [Bacteriovoracia bacterium]